MTGPRNARFVLTLWMSLVALWLVSGEQFLDLVFAIPDAGPVDDWFLSVVVRLDEARQSLGAPDLFGALRHAIHGWTRLG